MTPTMNAGAYRKKPTYLDILGTIERDEDKVELPERIALNMWDSFAMGQYWEMVAQAQSDQSAQVEQQQMDQAMTQAANSNDGVSKQELVGIMNHLQQANSAANATLHQSIQESVAASHRATEAHATALAQEMAMQSRKQDQRDAVVDQLRQSLAQAQTPASVPIPPPPSTQDVHHYYH